MRWLWIVLVAACGPEPVELPTPEAPDAWPALRGSGGPTVTFQDTDMWESCAVLDGDERDSLHHNLVAPYRGHLVMPWAPEYGRGGVSLFDMADPCNPVKVGETWSDKLRETHAMGFVHLPEGDPHAGDWMATNMIGRPTGILLWDLSDPAAPAVVAEVPLQGSTYPDSYTNVTLSLFWAYPYVYVASADRGIYIVDATDPRDPTVVVEQWNVPGGMRVGGVFVMGNRMLLTSAEQALSAMVDVSDPVNPTVFPGGLFDATDADGVPREYYHGNLTGNYAWFARKDAGSGAIVFDVSDPSSPTFLGDLWLEGGGGYIFYANGHAFLGASNQAYVIEARDPAAMTLLGTGYLPGDLDTLTPYGNVALLAVDEEAEDGVATTVMPWRRTPDTAAPGVLAIDPPDGATNVPLTARVGVGFDEFIEPSSVFAGSVRLLRDDGFPVPAWGSGQENTANLAPKQPLEPGVTYEIHVMAEGVVDINGNAVAETVVSRFTTVP